ncbi:MAG: NADH:flavin oxidoreductase [Pseudomonadales bacterium]|nr:NADH:flavin oxidoreductase [Pseudomonadales bacterium]
MPVSALESAFQSPKLKLKNRLVMAPMSRYFCPDNTPHKDVVDYYAKRAEAGVGLIITEGTFIHHPAAAAYKDVPYFWGEALNGWKEVVDAVHEKGGKIFPQLWHVGSFRTAGTGWDKKYPALSPSGVENSFSKTVPQSMTQADIDEVIKAYATAAKDAQDLGFDGIEIHAAHGYLIDEFFWASTNHRDDQYGGSQENRNRFALEIIQAIRDKVGEDFPIALRISQWKQQDYSAKIAADKDELNAWIKPLADAGVDLFHVSTRRFWEPAFDDNSTILAELVKKITAKPVIMVGSVGLDSSSFESAGVKDVELAMQGLADNQYDLIAVGRALLADAQWLEKMQAGELQNIRGFDGDMLSRLE